jgi:hypothetical protein
MSSPRRPFGPVWSLLKPRVQPTVEALPPRDTPATFTVSTLADAGPGSLRQAVLDANTLAGADTLVFAATGTLDLTSGALPITDALDVQGPGADRLTLRGNQTDRLFTLDDGQPGTVLVTVAGLTLTHGQATDGGALRNDEDLTLTDCTLTKNTATDDGGAILNRGTLTLRRCTLTGNTAGGGGGALYADGFGSITIRDSRISGNTAGGGGGGLYLSNSGPTLLTNTAITDNRSTGAGQGGGGLVARSGADVTLQQVTLAQNQATGANAAGGGILIDAGARLIAQNSTIIFNQASVGGGIAERATLNPQLVSTIVANNTATSQADLDGAFDAANSLIQQPGAAVLNPVGGPNVLDRDPRLTPLRTGLPVYLPGAGSPALDAGNNPASLTLDARGNPRTVGTAINIGAVERPTGAAVQVSGSAGVVVGYSPNGFGQLGAATSFTPFPDRAGVPRSTRADVDGDGVPDAIFVTGPEGGALVRIVSGRTGQDLLSGGAQDAYPGEDFTTIGLFVAAGDIDADGQAEIVVSPDQGGGARIQVFRVVSGQLQQVANFFGIDDPDFRGGGRIALGDVNGDHRLDLAVGAGFGGEPRVALFNGADLTTIGNNAPPKLIGDFLAFEPGLREGVFVAAGDVSGDGFAEVIFGGGPGGGPRVLALDGQRILANAATAINQPVANFFAFDATQRGGVHAAVAELDTDARLDLVIGSGDDAAPSVRTYRGVDLPASGQGEPTLAQVLTPFSDTTLSTGVFVG